MSSKIYDELLSALDVLRGAFNNLERRVIREKNEEVADEKHVKYWSNMTRERYVALITPPKEEDCLHLKGGRQRRGGIRDFAVRFHTYPDGSQKVNCTICRKEWLPGGPDWTEAMSMVNQSSNTPSSSEVIINLPLTSRTAVVAYDPLFNSDTNESK